jgi:hypothetical protein
MLPLDGATAETLDLLSRAIRDHVGGAATLADGYGHGELLFLPMFNCASEPRMNALNIFMAPPRG